MSIRRSQFLRLLGSSFLINRRNQAAGAAAPHLRLGILTDCQYADVETPPNSKRLYRKSPAKLKQAVEAMNQMGDLDFVIHLGDMIDRDVKSYEVVMPIFRQLRCPHYQLLGNHDYTVVDEEKASVPSYLGMERRFFSWSLAGWRFIVLDGNEISLFSAAKGSVASQFAEDFRKNSKRKLAEYNGGISQAQLGFLDSELRQAAQHQEKAIVFCHYPLWPIDAHALWNAEDVLAVLQRHSNTVAAWFNGHNHDGNYAARDGIHFLNFRGMVDTQQNCYARVELFSQHIQVTGFGREPSRNLILPAPNADPESAKPNSKKG